MATLFDTHVHIYPVHDWVFALQSAISNSRNIKSEAATAACPLLLFLTERPSESFFIQLARKKAEDMAGNFRIEIIKQELLIKITRDDGVLIYVIAGSQIVSTEGLEVLALMNSKIIERAPLETLIDKINLQDAVAVIPWSPGKWMFKRGKILREYFNRIDFSKIRVGDICIRPNLGLQPALMKEAVSQGCILLAGSDPLPFSGDEKLIGSYLCFSELNLNESAPENSLKALLSDKNLKIVGSRNSLLKALIRWIQARIA